MTTMTTTSTDMSATGSGGMVRSQNRAVLTHSSLRYVHLSIMHSQRMDYAKCQQMARALFPQPEDDDTRPQFLVFPELAIRHSVANNVPLLPTIGSQIETLRLDRIDPVFLLELSRQAVATATAVGARVGLKHLELHVLGARACRALAECLPQLTFLVELTIKSFDYDCQARERRDIIRGLRRNGSIVRVHTSSDGDDFSAAQLREMQAYASRNQYLAAVTLVNDDATGTKPACDDVNSSNVASANRATCVGDSAPAKGAATNGTVAASALNDETSVPPSMNVSLYPALVQSSVSGAARLVDLTKGRWPVWQWWLPRHQVIVIS
jgi:hypothetical protein